MPYTYLIGWSEHKQYYYGCRYAKGSDPTDLWVKYFTSSKYVARLRKTFGEPDIIQVRRTFSDRSSCIAHESRVLRRIVGHPNFINKNVAGAIVGGNPTPRTQKQRLAARASMIAMSVGEWYTDGINMKRIPIDAPPPEGWFKGYPDHYKQKIKDTMTGRPGQFKNMRWYTNGISRARYRADDVPEGWISGWKITEAK
jgi:hypothetical protein